ncbi:MAG: hypothetical protein IPI73_20890 [Betaproteobacteria bacterium]|nr:hypothetical protein [Betaproteobacteria bacterium]
MRVLFDQGVPVPLRLHLSQHEVVTAYERGWSKLKNGDLLDAAESNGFGVFLTTDTNLRYQQNLKSRRIAVVILTTTSWPRIQVAVAEVVRIVGAAVEGQYAEIHIP